MDSIPVETVPPFIFAPGSCLTVTKLESNWGCCSFEISDEGEILDKYSGKRMLRCYSRRLLSYQDQPPNAE
jgi:hypothetical protein